MSFGKVFAISILSLIVSNTIFIILGFTFGYGFDTILNGISGNPLYILYILFGPIGRAIWLDFDGIIYGINAPSMGFLLLNIAYIVAPLVAAIITGRLSDNRITSFVAFLVSAIISMLVCLILVLDGVSQVTIGGSLIQDTAILNVVLGSIVNGVLYGLIALALTRNK